MAIRVIILNGASSVGKTTLGKALQAALPDPWLRFDVDDLGEALPPQLHGAPEGLSIFPDGRVTTGPVFNDLADAWREGLSTMARCGARLIVDEVMMDGAANQQEWVQSLADLEILWVAVRCDPVIAAARELARGDRVAGMSASQAAVVHAGVAYHLEVDTSRASPEACAARVLAGA